MGLCVLGLWQTSGVWELASRVGRYRLYFRKTVLNKFHFSDTDSHFVPCAKRRLRALHPF